jgi:hypothetical protein
MEEGKESKDERAEELRNGKAKMRETNKKDRCVLIVLRCAA